MFACWCAYSWVGIVDDQELFAYLSLSGKVGYLRWSDFLDTVGDPYPTAGSYESRVYDAGRSVDFTRISWNEVCPWGTDVSFQVAVSEDPEGPWSYGSALTTAAGTTITSTTGRYARFKVSMTSDGSDTPVINDVQITHDGTSGSRVTRWTYDDAGNITEQLRVTDAGAETETRSYNNLNQLETSSGGWTYQFDAEGNMIGKSNGTIEGCEKWELSWDENSRLVQVKKGTYDATPTLVTDFQVDYSYDNMGRMLTRDDGTNVTDYFYDGWNIWKEVTGESVTEFLVPDLGVRSFLRDGELYTIHFDGLGSVRAVTNSVGSVTSQVELDAWGQALSGSVDMVPANLPMGFVGALGVRKDPVTGLHYMRKRWYCPQQQRFLSRDPVGNAGGTNLYVYTINPVNQVDPYGLNPVMIGAAGSVLMGMGIRAALGEPVWDLKQIAADAALGGLFTKWSLLRQASKLGGTEAAIKASYVAGIRKQIAQGLRGKVLKRFMTRRNICLIVDESSAELLTVSGNEEIAGISVKILKPNPYMSRRLEEQAGQWVAEANNSWLDSEYKGFRYLGQINVSSAFAVFTERMMCPGCTGAMCEFEKATGSRVVVLWGSLVPETAAWGTQLAQGLGSFGAVFSNIANLQP